MANALAVGPSPFDGAPPAIGGDFLRLIVAAPAETDRAGEAPFVGGGDISVHTGNSCDEAPLDSDSMRDAIGDNEAPREGMSPNELVGGADSHSPSGNNGLETAEARAHEAAFPPTEAAQAFAQAPLPGQPQDPNLWGRYGVWALTQPAGAVGAHLGRSGHARADNSPTAAASNSVCDTSDPHYLLLTSGGRGNHSSSNPLFW